MEKVTITRPSDEELKKLKIETWSRWEKEPSQFDWEYDTPETFYVFEGDVTVKLDDGSEVRFGPGDLVHFNAGVKCTWIVHKTIKKAYTFE